jgi:hypothetical protein
MIKSIQLISEECLFVSPQLNEEIEQHLTVSNTGRVWLSRYGFQDIRDYRLLKTEYAKITPEEAEELFGYLKEYLDHFTPVTVMDAGMWELTIRYDDGKAVINGPLIGGVIVRGTDLSRWIQEHIPFHSLMAFGDTESEEET